MSAHKGAELALSNRKPQQSFKLTRIIRPLPATKRPPNTRKPASQTYRTRPVAMAVEVIHIKSWQFI